MSGQRIGVLGASGGIGASTLVLGVSRRAADAGMRVVCLDGQWFSGGLDVVAGVEDQPGLRWPDLRGVQGALDGADLLAELPAAAGVSILSVDRSRPTILRLDAVASVLDSLTDVVDLCVLDLPRWGLPLASDLALLVEDLVLLGGASAVGLGATAALHPLLGEPPGRSWLAQRDGTADPYVGRLVAELTGWPLLDVVPDDRAVPRALAQGCCPGGGDGTFAKACARILTELRLQVVSE